MNIGIEHWHTDWPQSSGSLVWQYNDCWPGPTWSSVDYYGRWKAAHYGFRRAYAPVMIAGFVDPEANNVELKVASDLQVAAEGRLEWRLTDLDGKLVDSGDQRVDLPAGAASTAGPALQIGEQVKALGANHALLWFDVSAGDHSHSNLVLFQRPKDLDLVEPRIEAHVTAADDGYDVTLTSGAPALWTWLTLPDADARYSDNFVHLYPGKPITIHVTPSQPMAIEQVRASLLVRSLRDTHAAP